MYVIKYAGNAMSTYKRCKLPSDKRSAGGSGEGEPFLSGSPDRPLLRAKSRRKRRLRYAWRCGADLLYRQRHVFFSAGRKENVGLKQWGLKDVTL